MAELEAGLDHIRQSPRNEGRLMLIVRRTHVDERELIPEGSLHPEEGLVGDSWKARSTRYPKDRAVNTQITMINARAIALIAQDPDRWPLAGDQLYIDLDLSDDNLPPGTRLVLGSAILEVSAVPHTGCKKFSSRFGIDAMKFVNSPEGKRLHLRGINARVIQAGTIRVGDLAQKI
jgi:MOSC domain-containing protein YiiM